MAIPYFVIMTPNRYEFEAVRKIIKEPKKEEIEMIDEALSGYIGSFNVVCAQTGYGTKLTTNSFKILYEKYKPRYVIMIGIAGGNDRYNVNLGDVVIANSIIDSSSARIASDGYQLRTEFSFTTDYYLTKVHAKHIIENVEHKAWKRKIGVHRPEKGKGTLKGKLGCFISSDFLIENLSNEHINNILRG